MKLEKFFKAIIDEDRASVVICDKEHTIIYGGSGPGCQRTDTLQSLTEPGMEELW